MEQAYTLEPGVDLISTKMDDDASALDLFFLSVIKKNIHILDADINNIRIRDDFSEMEKQKLQDAADQEDPPINMVFDNGEIKLNYKDDISIPHPVTPTPVSDNTIEDYYNKLRRKGIFFIDYEDEKIKMNLYEPYNAQGLPPTDIPKELPVFKDVNSIPEEAKEILNYVVITSPVANDMCKYDVMILVDPSDPESINYHEAATKEDRYWTQGSHCLPEAIIQYPAPKTLLGKKVLAHCKNNYNACLNWKDPNELIKVGTFNDTSGKNRKEGCDEDNIVLPLQYMFGCGKHPYGQDAYLSPAAAKAFKKMNEDYPHGDIPLESAYRDYFHQQVVKADVKAGAGKSRHGWGEAIDVSNRKARKWIEKNGKKYGWNWPNIKGDPNHFTFGASPITENPWKNTTSRGRYINEWKVEAINQMKKYGIPASITMAQAILESGNGNSTLTVKGNNHFGIKCHQFPGEKIYLDTEEEDKSGKRRVEKGVCFRKYKSGKESFEDHSKFLKKYGRYKSLFDLDIEDYTGWAKGLKKAGYATGGKYDTQLIKLIKNNKLNLLDQIGKIKSKEEGEVIVDPNLPRNFAQVPMGDDIYRSSQPTKAQFKYILENKDFNINTVMRLNGETARGLSPEEEKEYVESLGKKYIFIDSHEGYIKGKGYTTSLKDAKKYLEEGHILVHCTGGMDRTGYQIGKFLQDEGYGSKEDIWKYTIPFNSWEEYICTPPPHGKGKNYGYIKYMEAFYPLKEWCEEDIKRTNCESCKKYGYGKK